MNTINAFKRRKIDSGEGENQPRNLNHTSISKPQKIKIINKLEKTYKITKAPQLRSQSSLKRFKVIPIKASTFNSTNNCDEASECVELKKLNYFLQRNLEDAKLLSELPRTSEELGQQKDNCNLQSYCSRCNVKITIKETLQHQNENPNNTQKIRRRKRQCFECLKITRKISFSPQQQKTKPFNDWHKDKKQSLFTTKHQTNPSSKIIGNLHKNQISQQNTPKSKLISHQKFYSQILQNNPSPNCRILKDKIYHLEDDLQTHKNQLSYYRKLSVQLQKNIDESKKSLKLAINQNNAESIFIKNRIDFLQKSNSILANQNRLLIELNSKLQREILALQSQIEQRSHQIDFVAESLELQKKQSSQKIVQLQKSMIGLQQELENLSAIYQEQQKFVIQMSSNSEQKQINYGILRNAFRKRIQGLEERLNIRQLQKYGGIQLRQYADNLFVKLQNSTDRIMELQLKMIETESQSQQHQKQKSQLARIVDCQNSELQQLRQYTTRLQPKVIELNRLLNSVNSSLISKQLELQNYILENKEKVIQSKANQFQMF